MPAYLRKPVRVEAVQWFPGVEIPEVQERPLQAIFSATGKHYYVDGWGVRTTRWLPLDGEGDVLPFAFYEVRAGEKRTIDTADPLYKRYAEAESWTVEATASGIFDDGSDYRQAIAPGTWIVRDDEHGVRAIPPAEFAADYEPA